MSLHPPSYRRIAHHSKCVRQQNHWHVSSWFVEATKRHSTFDIQHRSTTMGGWTRSKRLSPQGRVHLSWHLRRTDSSSMTMLHGMVSMVREISTCLWFLQEWHRSAHAGLNLLPKLRRSSTTQSELTVDAFSRKTQKTNVVEADMIAALGL